MSTKIIKVLRDDKFEELLGIFNTASAEEVIFVLPKKSKSFSKEAHFEAVAAAAEESGKKVSFLASDPGTSELITKYNFGLLGSRPSAEDKEPIKPAPAVHLAAKADPYTGEELEDDLDEEDDEEEKEDLSEDADEINEDNIEEDPLDESSESGLEEEEEEKLEEEDAIEEEDEQDIEPEEVEDEVDDLEEKDVEEDEELGDLTNAQFENPNDFQIMAAAASRKNLGGILRRKGEVNIDISQSREAAAKLKIKKEGKEKALRDINIENVWARQQGSTIWSDEKSSRQIGIWKRIFGSKKQKIKGLPKRSFNRVPLVIAVLSVVLLGSIIYMTTGSAKIIIKPQQQKLDIPLRVTASDAFSSVDPAFNKIPGQLFNIERSVSENFSATGEKEVAQKARGKITVYNEHSSSGQPLIATTRFESSNGLIFRTLQSITVPGTKVENGKIIPGTVEVEIIADKPGQDYNVAAGDFKIPAFREKGDNDKYEKIYGRTTAAMKGGIVGKAKVITETDYNNAKKIVMDKVTKDINDALAQQTSGLKIINGTSISFGFNDEGGRVDDAIETFTLSATARIKTIGFKNEDLHKLITQYVDRTSGLTVLPERLDISFSGITLNDAQGTLQFTANIKGSSYSKVEQDKIINDLLAKKEDEIKSYLSKASGVASAKITLSPFWVTKIPKNKDKVQIILSYD